MVERDLYGGLIRLHILHHASHGSIFGLGIIDELACHGYKLSAGTLYPLLHGLEKAGYLVSHAELVGGKSRRMYVVTEAGKNALRGAKAKVRHLFRELFEEEPPSKAATVKPALAIANGTVSGSAVPRRKKRMTVAEK